GLCRKRAGITRSVSMLTASSGTATAVTEVKGSTSARLASERSDVGEAAGDRGAGGRGRAHEVRAHALTLASFEVAVGRRRHALPGAAGVAFHADAHRAARLAPLEPGLAKDPVEALRLRRALDQAGARHHPGRHHDAAAADD